jgi:hypothetical protein
MTQRTSLVLVAIFVMASGSLPLKVLSRPARPDGAAAMMASPAPKSGQVTRMQLRAVPKEYRGACPQVIRFIGLITFDGPGKVVYSIQRSDRAKPGPERKLAFAGAGTKRIDDTWEIRKSYTGWEMLVSGDQQSNKAEFRVECTK